MTWVMYLADSTLALWSLSKLDGFPLYSVVVGKWLREVITKTERIKYTMWFVKSVSGALLLCDNAFWKDT